MSAYRFESKDRSVEEVVFGVKKLRVPQFQRPYTWSEDQCADMWSDLIDEEFVFFGQFILNHENEQTEKYIDIVDGQQRITTMLILSALLRDEAKKIGADMVVETIQGALVSRADFSGPEFRVTISPTASDFFKKNIQSEDSDISKTPKISSEEESYIYKNYLFFKEKFCEVADGMTPGAKQDFIKKIFQTLRSSRVIATEIYDENDAYEIFESVNATGVDLSVADLLKNYLFKKIRVDGGTSGEVIERWNELVSNIKECDVDLVKFIRYYWLSKYQFVSESKLFRSIKNKQDLNAREFLEDLLEASRNLLDLRNPQEADFSGVAGSEKLKLALAGIKVMDVSQCYVFFLSLYRNRNAFNTNWIRVFEIVEKFNYLYHAVSKQPANKVERLYHEYAIKIEALVRSDLRNDKKSVGMETIINELRQRLIELVPQKEIFLNGFKKLNYKSKKDLCRYTLIKMERSAGLGSGEYELNLPSITIEHILPQKPGKDWGLTSSDVRQYVHNIGNLTLLGKKPNGTVQNKSIADKIQILKTATEIQLTLDLLKEIELTGSWDENSIDKRATSLAESAYSVVWKI